MILSFNVINEILVICHNLSFNVVNEIWLYFVLILTASIIIIYLVPTVTCRLMRHLSQKLLRPALMVQTYLLSLQTLIHSLTWRHWAVPWSPDTVWGLEVIGAEWELCPGSTGSSSVAFAWRRFPSLRGSEKAFCCSIPETHARGSSASNIFSPQFWAMKRKYVRLKMLLNVEG